MLSAINGFRRHTGALWHYANVTQGIHMYMATTLPDTELAQLHTRLAYTCYINLHFYVVQLVLSHTTGLIDVLI